MPMKTCPDCKRTLDETLTYCLVDGTVLSAQDDSDEIPGVTVPNVTIPAPTVVLNPTTSPGSLRPPQLSTIVSPQPLQLYSPKQQSQLKQEQSRKPWLAIGIAISVGLILVVGAFVIFTQFRKEGAAPAKSDSKIVNANVNPAADCFAGDPKAGSTDRESHYSWAKGQNAATLEGNLKHKVDLLFQCSSMDGEKLANAFADISVIVARYVPGANCFGGDAGVTSTDWSGHKTWGLSKGVDVMRENLHRKIASALKCTKRTKQSSFFADLSIPIAAASSR